MKDRITLRHIKYMLAAAIGIFVILAFLLFTAVTRHTRVQTVRGQTAGQKTECYASIQVRPGESLWKISKRYYSQEYKNMNLYIKRIMKLNHMASEDIHVGAYLIIPYYEQEAGNM